MIPNQDYGKTISSGNMATSEATIELTPAMFNILSNQIYSDKVLAVIRETLCNARDAQEEANSEKEVEVHLPNQLEPFFYIRDFGNGLSERQICGHYSTHEHFNSKTGAKETIQVFVPGLYLRYGMSTKTESNEFIGGLGIGCKSPLAYSDSFLVESYQEGTCKTYSVYKENGKPQVSKLTETLTTKLDGLKVKLAVREGDTNEFGDKAEKFLKFFGYPTTIKGGYGTRVFESPVPVLETPLYTTYKADYAQRGVVSVLMGGVVYNLTSQYKERLLQIVNQDCMLLRFDIGTLTVAASREGLSEDPQTVAAIEARIEKVSETFYEDLVKQIDACVTPSEAFDLLVKYKLVNEAYRGGLSWKVPPAASKLIIRGGKTIASFLDEHKGQYRVITPSGARIIKTLKSLARDSLVLLDVDKGTGYVKVARNLAKAGKVVVFLANPTHKVELEAFFGTLETKKVSVEHPVMFPKAVRDKSIISVASSGLSTHLGLSVRTLEKDQEGFYIPFLRNHCKVPGMFGGGSYSDCQSLISTLVGGGAFTDDEIFFARRAGMPAVKKTKLKELTLDVIVSRVKAVITQDDINVVAQYKGASACPLMRGSLRALWEAIKDNYPLNEKAGKCDVNTKVRRMLTSLPHRLVDKVAPDYEKLLNQVEEDYTAEEKRFKAENELALAIPSWAIGKGVVDELIAFSQFKREQTKTKKQERKHDS
jgi:hypothetical protein